MTNEAHPRDIVSLIVKLTEAYCDTLQIQIRSGTDATGAPYATSEPARSLFFRVLQNHDTAINELFKDIYKRGYDDGTARIQEDVRETLGIPSEEDIVKSVIDRIRGGL